MKFFRRNWLWLVLSGILLGWLFASQGVRNFVVRRQEHRRLKTRLAEAEKRLTEKQDRLNRARKDEAFLELEARRHLGLVRPDEVEFRFVPSTAPGRSEEKMEKRPPAQR